MIPVPENDSSLSISGSLTNDKKTPLNQYAVSLVSITDNNFLGADTTDGKGAFDFPGLDYTDSTKLFIQIKNPKGLNEEVDVTLNSMNYPFIANDRSYTPGEPKPALVDGTNYFLNRVI